MPTKRRDTRLQAEGAEFFVLSQLLIEGIHAFKAYTNFPGWDLIAVNPARKIQKTIQVKSRLPTGAKSFPIKNRSLPGGPMSPLMTEASQQILSDGAGASRKTNSRSGRPKAIASGG